MSHSFCLMINLSLSLTLSLTLSRSLSVSRFLTHIFFSVSLFCYVLVGLTPIHTFPHLLFLTLTCFLSVSLTLSHTQPLSLSVSISHSLFSLCVFFSLTHSLVISLFLSPLCGVGSVSDKYDQCVCVSVCVYRCVCVCV